MKSSLFFILTFLSVIHSTDTFAMGSKRPKPPAQSPAPAPAPVTPAQPTLDFGEKLSSDAVLNSSAQIGPAVDDQQNSSELSLKREAINSDVVDKCMDPSLANGLFSEQISYYVAELINDVPAMVGFIGSSYGTSSSDSAYFPTSLIRHPLCQSSAASLSKTLNKVPEQKTIDKLNRFADEINELRASVLAGDQTAKAELLSSWNRLFSCLAYTESLSTADSSSSFAVAKKVAPTGYRKPAGVKFYEDPAQDAVSRLNIGMYQFTPNASGNIQPCLRAWNALNKGKPACQLGLKSSQSELIKILGSSLQAFNAFCGIHKLVQTFAIQVNTSKSSATHPSNIQKGKFLPQENRCVTPHFQAGRAYNHFGPFQNSTGSNLEKLFSCVEKSR